MEKSKKGSAIGAALVIALAITLITAGLIKWVDTERRITERHVLLNKARIGANAVGEFGDAQIVTKLQQSPIVASDYFRPGKSPPNLPSTAIVGTGLSATLQNLTSATGSDVLTNLNTLLANDTATPTGRYSTSPGQLIVGDFSVARTQFMDPSNPLYASDPLRNQTVNVREVTVLSSATANDTGRNQSATAYTEQVLQMRDASLTNFAILYNPLLEIAPGASMDIHGPVHSNRDVYVQTSSTLTFHGILSTAGKIFHGRAPGANAGVANGAVNFLDGTSSPVNMKQGSDWIDSSISDWDEQSDALWDGNVLTGTQGITSSMPAAIPQYVPDDPSTPANELDNSAHMLVENAVRTDDSGNFPGDEIEGEKFVSRASLVFTVSASGSIRVYKYSLNPSGAYVRRTSTGTERVDRVELQVPTNLTTWNDNKFYDYRRAKWIDSVDLDVGKLKTLIEDSSNAGQWTNGSTTFNPATEWNGVVFFENNDTADGALRLVNGSDIPTLPTAANSQASGFTVATNAPAYVLGNYNADGTIPSSSGGIRDYESGEPPAAIAADAVTILSNAWDDANSNNSSTSARTASTTEVSAAMLTGIVPSNKGNNGTYSGGVENLPRFLESWSGKTFGYRGSMIVLYESEIAIEPWGSSNVYSPPNRVWGFNKLFEQGIAPPGMPGNRSYRIISFRNLTPDEFQAAVNAL